MKVLTEEVFGPIPPIITVENEEEAVSVANDTEYGLGAAIWSRNLERAERLATRIEAAAIAINDMVKSDPRLPFGGIGSRQRIVTLWVEGICQYHNRGGKGVIPYEGI